MGKHDASTPIRSKRGARKAVRHAPKYFTPIVDADARAVVQWYARQGLRNPEIEAATGLKPKFVWTWAARQETRSPQPRGPQPLITATQGLELKKAVVKKRFASCSKLRRSVINVATGRKVCAKTINKALKRAGAISVKVKRCQHLTVADKARRLSWCERQAQTKWDHWIFSDEKWWRCGGVQGNERIWVDAEDPDPDERYVGKRANPPKLHAWAAISKDGRSSLHIFDHTVDSTEYIHCLENAFLPALYRKDWLALDKAKTYMFSQDGASSHFSKETQRWQKRHLPKRIRVEHKGERPPRSPDLNPIERLWAILSNRVVERDPQTLEEMKKVLVDEWWKIPQATIRALISSMSKRVERCIVAKGGRFSF